MSTDSYSIHVAVDSTSAVTATRNLNGMAQATGRSEQALSGLGGAAKIAGAAFAAMGIASLIKDVIKINMEFESLRASLQTVTGSAKNAQIAFEGINAFAAKTPYSVKEVTEAFIKMKALGLAPTEKALSSFGNTASAMGKSLNQMIEAVADATTGEFERLKEFGIKSSKQGDDIKFTFQGVETKIKNSSENIIGYLQALGLTKFAGGMELQGQTMKGTLSSLSDAWDNFIDHISNDKSEGAISRWIVNATEQLGKFDIWINGATTSIGKLTELQLEQNNIQASINAHKKNGAIGGLIDDISGFDIGVKMGQLEKNIQKQKELRATIDDERKKLIDITNAAPVSKVNKPDKKADAAAKKEAAKATKDLALAEASFRAEQDATVATSEVAGKLLEGQSKTQLLALSNERKAIEDKAKLSMSTATEQATKNAITQQTQDAIFASLDKTRAIEAAIIAQSAATIDIKIAAAQAELDTADKYNLTLAEQLRLKSELAGLQAE